MAEASQFAAVWRIYDDYRRSLYHAKYFEAQVLQYQSWVLWLNIFIVIGTSTTGIAGWTLWNKPEFAGVWAAIAGGATTLAVVKPILKWEDLLVKLTKALGDYKRIAGEYDALVGDMADRQELDAEIRTRYIALRKKAVEIDGPPLRPDPNLVARLKDEVIREKPMGEFWSPPKPKSGRKRKR